MTENVVNKWVIIDTETTGLKGKMIQFAYKDNEGVPIDFFYNPQIPIEYGAMAVHGITNRDLQSITTQTYDFSKQYIEDIINKYSFIVGHNIEFDAEIIKRTFDIDIPKEKLFCTLKLAKYLGLKDVVGSLTNMALFYYFKEREDERVESVSAHNASFDVEATHYVLTNLLELANSSNLAELKDEMDNAHIRVCMFPKHAGKPWTQVIQEDASYVTWLISVGKITGDVLDYVNNI